MSDDSLSQPLDCENSCEIGDYGLRYGNEEVKLYLPILFCGSVTIVDLQAFLKWWKDVMLCRYLDVSSDAELEEIKSAYRRLSKLYHPDTTQLPLEIAAEKFMRLKVSLPFHSHVRHDSA